MPHNMPPPLYAARCGPAPAHTRLTPAAPSAPWLPCLRHEYSWCTRQTDRQMSSDVRHASFYNASWAGHNNSAFVMHSHIWTHLRIAHPEDALRCRSESDEADADLGRADVELADDAADEVADRGPVGTRAAAAADALRTVHDEDEVCSRERAQIRRCNGASAKSAKTDCHTACTSTFG